MTFVAKYHAGEIQVLDVREQEEYDALHLDGVILSPLSVLAERYAELDKDQALLCHLQVWSAPSACACFFGRSGLM